MIIDGGGKGSVLTIKADRVTLRGLHLRHSGDSHDPAAKFFRNAIVLELLDFLERLAPFSSPMLILRDAAPRMRPWRDFGAWP